MIPHPPCHDRTAAFTLVEVLAGLVLIAILLPVAMRAIGVGTSSANMTRHRLEAVSLAQSKLDERVATRAWERADEQGTFDEPFNRYTWTIEMSHFEGDIHKLSVEVSWQTRGEPQSVRVATLVDTADE